MNFKALQEQICDQILSICYFVFIDSFMIEFNLLLLNIWTFAKYLI